jgi:hypothetical protein
MAIIIGGVITNLNAINSPGIDVEKKEHMTVEEINSQRKIVKSQPRKQYNPEDHLVVVNGKEKKIGKQSKYLLDMLTIED